MEAPRTEATGFPVARARLWHEAWIKMQPARYTQVPLGLLIAVVHSR
jgi:hypothetical protein